MKKLPILCIILFTSLFILTSWATTEYYFPKDNAGDILLGEWQPSNGLSVIRISKGNESKKQNPTKYYGHIVWLKDKNNPDESKKSQQLAGMTNMIDLEFTGTSKNLKWANGSIYDPKNGSDYTFKITMDKKNPNLIDGRGYIGISMFGRTDTWKRLVKK